MQAIHDLGKNGDATNGDYDKDKAAGLWQACMTAVQNYYCPSRHPSLILTPAASYSYLSFTNAGYGSFPQKVGQTDYAGNLGNAQQFGVPNGAWPTNAWSPQGIEWYDQNCPNGFGWTGMQGAAPPVRA